MNSVILSHFQKQVYLKYVLERHEMTPDSRAVLYNHFLCIMCKNERITKEMILCVFEYFPDAIKSCDENRRTVLHYACINKQMNRKIMQLLVDADPTTPYVRD